MNFLCISYCLPAVLIVRIQKELVNEIAPIIIQSCEIIIKAEDADLSLSCFHYLLQLTGLLSKYQNNLLIDRIIHFLVDCSTLSFDLITYSTTVSTEEPQAGSSNLILTKISKEQLQASMGKQLLYIEYNPIQQIIQFGSPIKAKAYSTLLLLIAEYGTSIQQGYNEIVSQSFNHSK